MGRKEAGFLSIPMTPKDSNSDNPTSTGPVAGPERPKSVLSSRLWGIAYPLHLVALGLTVAVLQLSFREVYFADVGAYGLLGGLNVNEAIKGIQVAAKFHEIFIVASLAAIVSHLTRSCLLGKRGVPLGLVSAPFKVGSADYIFSREFFGSITRPYGLFSLGILLTTIVMLALGPASAMALVPSIGWWEVLNPYSGLDRPIWIGAHPEDLWPQSITPEPGETCTVESIVASCPAAGFRDLQSWASSNVKTGRPANITLMEPMSGTRRRLQSQFEDPSDETLLSYFPRTPDLNNVSTSERRGYEIYLNSAGITTLTTTASHWVTLLLGGFWTYANTMNLGLINRSARPKFKIDNAPIYEPLVSVRCAAYDYRSSRESQGYLTAPYVRNAFGATGLTDYNNIGWAVPQTAWNFSRPLNSLNFTWINVQALGVNASIGGLFSIPYPNVLSNGTALQESVLLPCTVEARWIASELVYDPMSSDILSDNVTDPINFAHGHHAEYDVLDNAARFGASPIINITDDWANQLNIPVRSHSIVPGDNTSIAGLAEMYLARTFRNQSLYTFVTTPDAQYEVNSSVFTRDLTQMIGTVLGLAVTDGLSRLRYGTRELNVIYHRNSTTTSSSSLISQAGPQGRVYNDTHASNLSSSLAASGSFYNLDVQRWGYGYGLETKASRFSVSILMLYGCIVLCYITWFNIQSYARPRSDWSLITNKWSTISEMLALAINSPPSTKLDGTCAGIEAKQSWKQIIRIREVEDKHLALVVGEGRNGHPRVQRNVQYGALPSVPVRPIPREAEQDER